MNFHTRCTGTNCEWRDKCALALASNEYRTQIIVPLKENTAENCHVFKKHEPEEQAHG